MWGCQCHQCCHNTTPLITDSHLAQSQFSYLNDVACSTCFCPVIVLLDFVQNYSFIIQDAVQGHHWVNSQATLYPFVIYYTSEDQLKYLNVCIVSDCCKHDPVTVHAFILAMVSFEDYTAIH